jgi:hypothetical protein
VIATSLRHHPEVINALRLYSYLENWQINLYEVLEIIRHDVGREKQMINFGWASPGELVNFKSVYDPASSGRCARHAVHNGPSPPAPMDEDTARAFIVRLLETWLRHKYKRLRASGSAP